jgi:hypothetical protein
MNHGWSIRILGNNYLLAVLKPEQEYDSVEFKRYVNNKEQLLCDEGWLPSTDGLPRQIPKDTQGSKLFFAYYMDENVDGDARYCMRLKNGSAYTTWTGLDPSCGPVLPAPTNIRIKVNRG